MPDIPAGIDFAERGEGPALLFIPGSFGTGAGWKAVIDNLGSGYRFITTSLLGYGATAERRPPGCATMQEQTDVLDILFERIAEPVHVVAHSFGGLAALAHAIHGKIKPASLILIEANPFGILRSAGEKELYATFGAMTRVYFAEFEAGKPDAARHVIDFYEGQGTFDAFSQKVRDYIIATTPSNIRDWSAATPFEPSPSDYARIEANTVVIRGGNGHPAMRRIAGILAAAIENARLETINGGSHLLPSTHPSELARLIRAQVAAATA
jgi:pimeloyl-ACP methyl ester carboxylesterase